MSGDQEAVNREYIQNKIHPIFERLIMDLLVDKPDDVVPYMKKWLDTNTGDIKPREQNQLVVKKPVKEDMPDSEEDDDDEVDELPQVVNKQVNKKGRSSVSAEAYGAFNKKGNFKPKVVPKNEASKQRIRKKLEMAFMFQALDEKETLIVIDAMEEKKFKVGDWVIKQGEEGDNLYVVDSGELNCYKKFKKEQEQPTFLKTYQPGESFGELALLYNAPRAASIQAKTEAVLFALDRETFNHIVKDAAAKKREQYEEFLKGVELLETMDPYERSKIADALKKQTFKKGEYIIKQGEQGDNFFMLEHGELVAQKVMNPGDKPTDVYNYKKPGEYFGELSLIKDAPRAASIICKTDATVVTLDRYSFKRLLGPIEEILKRNQGKYDKFNK